MSCNHFQLFHDVTPRCLASLITHGAASLHPVDICVYRALSFHTFAANNLIKPLRIIIREIIISNYILIQRRFSSDLCDASITLYMSTVIHHTQL